MNKVVIINRKRLKFNNLSIVLAFLQIFIGELLYNISIEIYIKFDLKIIDIIDRKSPPA